MDTALTLRAQELCESRGGRPGLPVPNSPYGLCGRKATLNERTSELNISVKKIEVAVLYCPSLISLMVSVDTKQHLKKNEGRTGSPNRATVPSSL